MIRVNVEPGSEEWRVARLGIPTASGFSQILTPAKLEYSKQSVKYRNRLVAEWILGYPVDWNGESQFMERGKDVEDEARAWYELKNDVEAERVGFVMRDDAEVGGSPDSLIGDEGGLEIKVPAIDTHIGYLLEPQKLVEEYRGQVQGYLYLTDRNWWDVVSYHRALPKVCERVVRDPNYILKLDAALVMFLADLNDVKERLAQYKQEPYVRLEATA